MAADDEVHLLLLPADSNSLDRQHPDDAYVELDIHPVPVVADPIQNEIDTNCRSQPAQDDIAFGAANLAINRYQVVLTEYRCGQEELLLKELLISHPPSPTVRVTVAALSGTDSAMFDKIFNALLESFTFYNSNQLASAVPTNAVPIFTPTSTATPAPTIMVGTPVPNIVEQMENYTVRIWHGSNYPDHLPGRGYYGTATLTHVNGRELIIPDANQLQPLPVSDINRDGYPDVALLMRAGGSHCCQGTALYSLGAVPTKLLELWDVGFPNVGGGRGDFRDLNQDGIFEFVIKGLPFGDLGLAVLHYVPNQGYIGGSYRFPQVYEEVLPEIVAHAEQFPDDPFAVDDVAINYLYMGLPIEAWINIARIYEVASRYRELFDLHEELTRKAIHSHLFAAKPPGIRVIDDFADQLESIAQPYQLNDAGGRNRLTTTVLPLDSPRYWESYAVSHQLLLEYDMQGEAGQRYVGLERCFDEGQDWSQTPILDTAIRNPTDHAVTFFLQFGEGKRCGTEPFTGEVWRTAFMLQPNESRVLTLPLNSFDYFMRTGWSPQQNGAIDLQQIGYFAFGVETDEPQEGVLHVSPIRLWP